MFIHLFKNVHLHALISYGMYVRVVYKIDLQFKFHCRIVIILLGRIDGQRLNDANLPVTIPVWHGPKWVDK
jgi:hypothetical protein